MSKQSGKLKRVDHDLDKLDSLLDNLDKPQNTSKTKYEPSFNEDFSRPSQKRNSFTIPTIQNDKPLSDVSDAHQDDIEKFLRETENIDDMDDHLFKPKGKTSLSSTAPASAFTANKPPISKKVKSFEIDDPLDNIDNFMNFGNKTSPTKHSTEQLKPSEKTQPIASSPIVKKTEQKRPSLFDDEDDILDTLGFDKSKSNPSQNDVNRKPPPAKNSVINDLFSKSDKNDLEDKKDFKLDEKYVNMSRNAETSDEFNFGGYVPSTLTSTNRSTSKRNVKFENDLFGEDVMARPRSSSGQANTLFNDQTNKGMQETNPLSKSLPLPQQSPSKASYDWLGISTEDETKTNKRNDFDNWLQSTEKAKPIVSQLPPQPQQQQQQIQHQSSIQTNKPPKSGNSTDWLGLKESQNSSFERDSNLDVFEHGNKDKIKVDMVPLNQSLNGSHEGSDVHGMFTSRNQVKASVSSSITDSVDMHNTAIIKNNGNIFAQPFVSSISSQQNYNTIKAPVSEDGSDDQGWFNNVMANKKPKNIPTTMFDTTPINSNDALNVTNTNSLKITPTNNTNTITKDLMAPLTTNTPFTTDKRRNFDFLNNTNKATNLDLMFTTKTEPSISQPQYYGNGMGMSSEFQTGDPNDLLRKIQELQFEKQKLEMQVEHLKSNYELQLQMIKEYCENRVRMMKSNLETTQFHFDEEKQFLNDQINQLEKDKFELMKLNRKKYEEVQKEYNVDIEKLKEIQRHAIENLKEEHEQTIKRIRELKNNEVDAAMAASSHTRTIETVLNTIQDNARNIDELSQKVQINQMMNLSDKEAEIKIKEESLKLQEDRLGKKLLESETESKRLKETIQRLENHLAEQIKMVEEEKWKSKQQEKKLEALQDAVMNEQRIQMEKLTRERGDLDRAKDEILAEQRRIMQQVYEEKRKIAEEKAHLEANLQAYKDQKHKDSLSNISVEAELSVSTKYLKEERLRMEKLELSMKAEEEKLKNDMGLLENRRRELDMREAKLEQMAYAVRQKYSESESLFNEARSEKEKNAELLKQISTIKGSHDSRLQQIQQGLLTINQHESRLNQDKIAVLKQRQELEVYKDSILCTKCKGPIKDFGTIGMQTIGTTGYGTYIPNNSINNINNTIAAIPLGNSKKLKSSSNGLNYTTFDGANIDDAKKLRQLKLQALKDRQYLNNEKEFIETLKTNLNRSYSLTQLNKLIS